MPHIDTEIDVLCRRFKADRKHAEDNFKYIFDKLKQLPENSKMTEDQIKWKALLALQEVLATEHRAVASAFGDR